MVLMVDGRCLKVGIFQAIGHRFQVMTPRWPGNEHPSSVKIRIAHSPSPLRYERPSDCLSLNGRRFWPGRVFHAGNEQHADDHQDRGNQ